MAYLLVLEIVHEIYHWEQEIYDETNTKKGQDKWLVADRAA